MAMQNALTTMIISHQIAYTQLIHCTCTCTCEYICTFVTSVVE